MIKPLKIKVPVFGYIPVDDIKMNRINCIRPS